MSLKMAANWDVTQPGRHLTTILNELFWPNQTLMCDSYSEAVCVFFCSSLTVVLGSKISSD